MGNALRILYHLALAGLSAAIALSLPWMLSFAAQKILVYWSLLGNEKLFVVSVEMAVAISSRSSSASWQEVGVIEDSPTW